MTLLGFYAAGIAATAVVELPAMVSICRELDSETDPRLKAIAATMALIVVSVTWPRTVLGWLRSGE